MRKFYCPTVRLIGETVVDDLVVEEFGDAWGVDVSSDATSDQDFLPEFAGRLCYVSYDGRRPPQDGKSQNQTYLDHAYREMKHGSIVEHSYFNFLLTDLSRNCTHELVRHRLASYSQLSTRYVDQFDHDHRLGRYEPEEIASDPELADAYESAWAACALAYSKIFTKLRAQGMKVKEARSIARHCLPGSAGTAIVVTMNARALDHFFTMRGALEADPEIRRVALGMYEQVKNLALFEAWELATKDEKIYLRKKRTSLLDELSKSLGVPKDVLQQRLGIHPVS